MTTDAIRRIVLITGGSRGIGAAAAVQAADAGFDVALSYRNDADAAGRVAAAIRARGRRALAVQADTGRPADIARLFAEVDDGLGRITDLVNNAGVTGHVGPLATAAPDMIAECIQVNVTGAILVAREAIPRLSMRQGGAGGAIVNVGSVAATLGSPGEFVWYAASKGAIDSLTIGLSKELGPDGIRVNAVAPGLIDTEIHAAAGARDRLERLKSSVPIGREGSADEVARTIVFLLSDAASYVSGAVLRVAGGR
ncbi:SDR family oxidoreductase [Chelatococcus reniformis]|uniref:Glucose-1-dehydrogenase n=1 Tax=Chelatococcus reniformis TaxID=1494448 RepID=A0A916TZG8_9HYPH|nr:SDR family oxidoreductase [Chelatococcus reniformis]GGC53896.1 glucose-1-dehydrogenase [Chelatococcus reniformis]